jgi:DNA topoisomerase-2
MVGLKKAEKRGYVKVEGLDPANLAGGPKARECALVICEGESAKTYTVAGLDVGIEGRKGRDYIGIYPIRGKILNTRNASPAQIQANHEITGIRQALGLQLRRRLLARGEHSGNCATAGWSSSATPIRTASTSPDCC